MLKSELGLYTSWLHSEPLLKCIKEFELALKSKQSLALS